MKKIFFLPVFVALFAACSSPMLDWIETDTGIRSLGASSKAITAFSFGISGEAGKISAELRSADGKTPITIILPVNTSVDNLRPAIEFIGKSVSPAPGEPRNFSTPVTYRVTATDNSWRDYEVTVIVKTPQSAEIVWCDLEIPGADSPVLAEGDVIEGSGGQPGKIILHVPSGTPLANLTVKIAQTGTSISDNQGHSASGTAAILNDNFSSAPVTYTVTAENGTQKNYDVTIIVDKSGVKEITDFSFSGHENNETVIIGAEPQPDGRYPIVVTIPPPATALAALTPNSTYRGAAITGSGISTTRTADFGNPVPANGSQAADFTAPVTYRVTAEDGSFRDYEVTVYIDYKDTLPSESVKEITAFYFSGPVAVGVIDQAAKTITVTVPNGTNLNALSPTVSFTGKSLYPDSGKAANFSSPVTYTVTARDNTVQPYTVRVIPRPATTKEITGFSLPGVGVLETVIGAIPDFDGYTPISITVSDQSNISALCPTITHTGVSITPPGGTPQTANPFIDSARHFGNTQIYTITAEDGTARDYAVSVHVFGGGAKVITGFVFNSVSVGGGETAAAVGQIDQDTHTIEVRVPYSATITNLAPTITYLGSSLEYSDTSPGTPSQIDTNTGPAGQSDTFTDAPRDFSADRYYTVTAVDTTTTITQEYTVKVVKMPEITIRYEGVRDEEFITENFDEGTGLLTIKVTGTNYGAPHEWYVDGVKQPVSDTQDILELKTADFEPGTHQVTVSAKGPDNKHYTNLVYFLVQE